MPSSGGNRLNHCPQSCQDGAGAGFTFTAGEKNLHLQQVRTPIHFCYMRTDKLLRQDEHDSRFP